MKNEYNKGLEIVKLILASIVSITVVSFILNMIFPCMTLDSFQKMETILSHYTGIQLNMVPKGVGEKPVIYVYGEKDGQEVEIELDTKQEIICEYPYRNEDNKWKIKADTDGKITLDDKEYNYLYWETEYSNIEWDFTKGFCIKGEETKEFLEDTLKKIGLNRKESNEFIVYWLPRMEQNKYNLISFQTNIYEDNYKLNINPSTNNMLRVFMTFKGVNEYINIEEQDLKDISNEFERNSLHVVEWGGSDCNGR